MDFHVSHAVEIADRRLEVGDILDRSLVEGKEPLHDFLGDGRGGCASPGTALDEHAADIPGSLEGAVACLLYTSRCV